MKAENQNCQSLVDVVKQDLGKIRSEKELVRSIAVAVSDRMGGILDKWRVRIHVFNLVIKLYRVNDIVIRQVLILKMLRLPIFN